jgi:hypothetical protein
LARLEVNIEELEGLVGGGARGVATQLDIAFEDGREGDVSRGEMAEDGGGVDDGSASLVELEAVE